MSDFTDLQLDSNLKKNASQVIQPQGAAYASANPSTPANAPANYPNTDSPNVITGAVIQSCFIQTSALPYRAQLQNNQLVFFDDTTSKDGKVSGHTSQLAFTHTSGILGNVVSQGFLWEKRASTINTYDNVLSLYAFSAVKDPVTGDDTMNYMFFGLQGSFGNPQYNTNVIEFTVNHDNAVVTQPSVNGEFNVSGSTDGAEPLGVNFSVRHNSLVGVAGDGYSVLITGTGTGNVAIGGNAIGIGSVGIFQGAGSPSGVVAAPPGSLYLNTNGGSHTTLWVKESNSDTTGWVGK